MLVKKKTVLAFTIHYQCRFTTAIHNFQRTPVTSGHPQRNFLVVQVRIRQNMVHMLYLLVPTLLKKANKLALQINLINITDSGKKHTNEFPRYFPQNPVAPLLVSFLSNMHKIMSTTQQADCLKLRSVLPRLVDLNQATDAAVSVPNLQ